MRRINAEGLALIKRWEGCRLEAYRDVGGIWTVGYGHTRTARQGLRITQEQAEALLREDLRVFEAAVDDAVVAPLTDNQFASLVSWSFNVGVAAMRSSTLIRKLNRADYDAVPRELLRWNKVQGRPVSGLANRRAAEAGLWARGAFVASRNIAATEPPPSSPAAEAGKLGGVAAAAAAVAPAITSLGGVHWAVGVALVAGLVALAAVYLLRRREA